MKRYIVLIPVLAGLTIFMPSLFSSNPTNTNNPWADYVFANNYNLKPLNEVEAFIKKNGHLPNVPSATEVKENGLELGEMSKIQQEKIEELTLYLIEQKKEIETLKLQVKLLLEKK